MGSLHMRVTKGADIEAPGGCLEAGGGSQGRELALGMCRDGVAGPRGGERRQAAGRKPLTQLPMQ